MTVQERLEEIKGKLVYEDGVWKWKKIFYPKDADWLIQQAERAQKNAQDLEDMDRQLASEQKRINQLEKELLFTQESLRNSIKMCATQFENMQRYVKALKFYADEDIYTVQDGERIKGIFTDQGEKARKALAGNSNGKEI